MPSTRAESLLRAAAEGRLPDWAELKAKRYQHVRRVGGLMGEWALTLGLPIRDQLRWRATGWLHDALRDADPEVLRDSLDEPFRSLPADFLHGPACARRLAEEGVVDDDVLEAIRYHTLGRAGLTTLGRMLIAADFLEPGRPELPIWRASLRARMPEALDDVFATVVDTRIRVTLDRRKQLRPEFVAMWNSLVSPNGRAR
jgi:HD superfamily phosphohydrolase YqeK